MTFRTDPRHLLLIRTDRLGETLLNLPLAAALKSAFPQAALTWMVQPALVDLLHGAPGVDHTLGYQEDAASPWWRRALRLARRLRAGRFDVVLISNATKDFHAASWLAGIPIRAGYARKWGGLLTHRLEDRRVLGECHEVEYNMRLLSTLGLAVPASPALHLPVTAQAERDAAQRVSALGRTDQRALVVVHPWTSNLRKQWPLDRVRGLLERLAARARLVVVGGPEERPQSAALLRGREAPAADMTGELSLPVLAALLARARVVVTNDSGPMHLAAAVGTPVVALFGTGDAGSHPRRWGPWSSGHTVIHKPLEEITVEEVAEAVQRYLP